MAEAAAAAQVSEATVYRRLNDPAFAARVKQLRAAMFEAAAGQLAAEMADAVRRLIELSKSGHKDDAVKLRATIALIESAVRVRDATEVRDALDELKAGQDELKRRGLI